MRLRQFRRAAMAVAILLPAAASPATIIFDYTADAGGNNPNPLNGLAAQATWRSDGTTLTITLANTSVGVPIGAEVSDSLLVSLAFNLGDGISITSGVHAIIGTGSTGIGTWSSLLAGDSVADQWLWTNDGGGDLLEAFVNIISTSSGQGGGDTFSFNGDPDPQRRRTLRWHRGGSSTACGAGQPAGGERLDRVPVDAQCNPDPVTTRSDCGRRRRGIRLGLPIPGRTGAGRVARAGHRGPVVARATKA